RTRDLGARAGGGPGHAAGPVPSAFRTPVGLAGGQLADLLDSRDRCAAHPGGSADDTVDGATMTVSGHPTYCTRWTAPRGTTSNRSPDCAGPAGAIRRMPGNGHGRTIHS